MFGAVLGKSLDERALPATARLFSRMRHTEDAVVGPAKKAFKRVRPYMSSTDIKPLVRPSISGSYPSGHTTNATLAAIVMGDIVPEKRDAIWQRAADYSHSRVVGGMHYPNDLFGGKLAGTAIAVALQSRPEFKADFALARHELRQYLGLAP
jgi:acid phosphatase (class A)